MRDEIVVNDRWGKETRSKHGGFYTSEYETFVPEGAQLGPAHKWEEDQGIGKSFGYNRVEGADDYKSATRTGSPAGERGLERRQLTLGHRPHG